MKQTTFWILLIAGLVAFTSPSHAAKDFVAGIGIKGWIPSWENHQQDFETESGEMYGISGLMKYKKFDLSVTWLDGDFNLKGQNLDASRQELRASLGYSLSENVNIFIGVSDKSGDVEYSTSETINQVIGTDSNGVPIIAQTTREKARSNDYELKGFFLGGAMWVPIAQSEFFAYCTASIQPITSITVEDEDLDDGLGANFELGLGYSYKYISAKAGYRFERLDNGDDFEETLNGFVFVASVAL